YVSHRCVNAEPCQQAALNRSGPSQCYVVELEVVAVFEEVVSDYFSRLDVSVPVVCILQKVDAGFGNKSVIHLIQIQDLIIESPSEVECEIEIFISQCISPGDF